MNKVDKLLHFAGIGVKRSGWLLKWKITTGGLFVVHALYANFCVKESKNDILTHSLHLDKIQVQFDVRASSRERKPMADPIERLIEED